MIINDKGLNNNYIYIYLSTFVIRKDKQYAAVNLFSGVFLDSTSIKVSAYPCVIYSSWKPHKQ